MISKIKNNKNILFSTAKIYLQSANKTRKKVHSVLYSVSTLCVCAWVFGSKNAVSHENNDFSINDCLRQGINLNQNLLDLLLYFRLNKTAICSDINQAFLQICLSDEHKDTVRFLKSNEKLCVQRNPKITVSTE